MEITAEKKRKADKQNRNEVIPPPAAEGLLRQERATGRGATGRRSNGTRAKKRKKSEEGRAGEKESGRKKREQERETVHNEKH